MKWNPALYDTSHRFVSQFGEAILSYLNPKPGEKILDIGCGTGDLAQEISLSEAQVTGVDNSAEMIMAARSKFPGIDFYQMDARELVFDFQFDAIFSNAALHWIPEKAIVITKMYALLKDKGRIVLEFGGKGNNQKILAALRETFTQRRYHENAKIDFWYFPSIAEYAAELEKQNFRVIYAAHFDRDTPLKGNNGIKEWFKMFGDAFFINIPTIEKEDILNEVQRRLTSTHLVNGIWVADYKRIRIVAIK